MQQDVAPIHEERAQEGSPPTCDGLIYLGPQEAQSQHNEDERHGEDGQEASEKEHRHLRVARAQRGDQDV